MDLNVKGVFNTTRVAAECMVARGKGVILSTSSMVSISGQPSGIAYPASKFAVNGLTVSLARELGPKGIRVNAVAPGITETDMMKAVPKEVIEPMIERIPLRRLGRMIKADRNKSLKERRDIFLNKVGNPYLVRIGNMKVKVRFANNGISMEQAFENMLLSV